MLCEKGHPLAVNIELDALYLDTTKDGKFQAVEIPGIVYLDIFCEETGEQPKNMRCRVTDAAKAEVSQALKDDPEYGALIRHYESVRTRMSREVRESEGHSGEEMEPGS